MRLTVELTEEQAAGLRRFADKVSYETASGVLYGHVKPETRSEQAGDIIAAFAAVERALADADVSTWPWIETGQVV